MKVRIAAGSVLLLSAGSLRAAEPDRYIAHALQTSPVIGEQRWLVDAAAAEVEFRRAAGRPSLILDGVVQRSYASDLTRIDTRRLVTIGASFELPLYTGDRVPSLVTAATARLSEARANLDITANQLASDAAGAYADYLRDLGTLRLNRKQTEVIETNLAAARERLRFGDVTRTDVDQARARLEVVRANNAVAEAQLTGSSENFRRVVGLEPVETDDIAVPVVGPNTLAIADVGSTPRLRAAAARIDAAAAESRYAAALRRPSLSLFVRGGYDVHRELVDPRFAGSRKSLDAGLRLSVPLYQGGGSGARLREARARESVAIEQRIQIEREVVAEIRSRYSRLMAADARVASLRFAIEAARAARDGVVAENSFGFRTVLDVLNAEQELLAAETQLVSARQERLALAYSVLELMGQAAGRPDLASAVTRAAAPKSAPAPAVRLAGVMTLDDHPGWSLKPSSGGHSAGRFGPADPHAVTRA